MALIKRWGGALGWYVLASPLPHVFALFCLGMAGLLFGVAFAQESAERHALAAGAGLKGMLWLACALMSEADGLCRYREYLRARYLLGRYGFRVRILAALSSSRCQRDAARLAAARTGWGEQAREYFRGRGFRWYHLYPEHLRDDPFFLLSPNFLRAAFVPRRRKLRNETAKFAAPPERNQTTAGIASKTSEAGAIS